MVLLPPRCAASQPRLGNLALAGSGLPVRGLPCPRRLPVCGAPLRCRALGGRRLGGCRLRGRPLALHAVTDPPSLVARRPRCPWVGSVLVRALSFGGRPLRRSPHRQCPSCKPPLGSAACGCRRRGRVGASGKRAAAGIRTGDLRVSSPRSYPLSYRAS